MFAPVHQPSSFALLLIRAELVLVRANQKERECEGAAAVCEAGRETPHALRHDEQLTDIDDAQPLSSRRCVPVRVQNLLNVPAGDPFTDDANRHLEPTGRTVPPGNARP